VRAQYIRPTKDYFPFVILRIHHYRPGVTRKSNEGGHAGTQAALRLRDLSGNLKKASYATIAPMETDTATFDRF
jgi:hypothetical protein